MSLAELLRVLVNYLRVHDYCTSAKYSQAFVHVAHTSVLASNANACHETATYVCSCAGIHLHCFNPFSGLFVSLRSIQKNFTIITKQSSKRYRKIYFPYGQARATVKVWLL